MIPRWTVHSIVLVLVMSFTQACASGAVSNGTSVDPSEVESISNPLEAAWGEPAPYAAGLTAEAAPALSLLEDATEYHIDLILDDDLKGLSGQLSIRFANPLAEPLSTLYLRLYPNISGGRLDLTDLKVDSAVVVGSLESGDSVYKIPLPHPLPSAESVILEASFRLSLPLEMAGNYGLFGYHGGILLLQEFFPLLPVVDEDGWALETPPSHGDLTHLEAGFFLVRIQAPQDLVIVSSGTALQHAVSGDSQILLQAAGPARDFYLAASTDFTRYSLEKEGVSITNYASEADPETAQEMLEIASSALSIFDDHFGSYPYIEFDMIGTPMQALGMEYPGIIALASGLYDPQATISDLPSTVFMEGTVVHEVAHQWFYNIIGNDQVLYPWLDEAMAQYATGLYFRERYGESAYQQVRDSWLSRWDRVEKLEIPIGLATSAYDGREYGAIVYGRGPLFIEQLELSMGEERFSDFLSEYGKQLRWGIVTPGVFQELAETTCACDLQGIFDEWVVEN